MEEKIEKALRFCLNIAENDRHGYDQTHRYGPDYDCSSLIASALNFAGFNVNPYSWTGNLYPQLKACGFLPCTAPWQAGDIHLTPGHHVVMSVSPDTIVHASINELGKVTGGKTGDQTGKEICTRSFYTPSYGWKYHLRFQNTDTLHQNELIARQVLAGLWGNGEERKKKLTEAGYNYRSVQVLVNQLLNGYGKTDDEVAREVIRGKWGNGSERAMRLENAGYDYDLIQEKVNALLQNVKEN